MRMNNFIIVFFLTIPSYLIAQDINHWFPDLEIQDTNTIIEKKLALIVANTDYLINDLDLKNPKNDAYLIAQVLTDIGFDVIIKENLNFSEFKNQIREFKNKQSEYDLSLFYYAGHAYQDENGNSFLKPIDYSLKDVLGKESISVSNLLSYFERNNNNCLVILDACRSLNSNGFPKPSIEDPMNVKVAFSTSFGKKASDESHTENTLYARALSILLKADGLTINEILHNTSKYVVSKTQERQYPVDYFGIKIEDFKMNPKK